MILNDALKNSKYVVAPMVQQSELAWRLLSIKYGAQLVFTPMLHAKLFATSKNYRSKNPISLPDGTIHVAEKEKLIVQFCGNDPEFLVAAARLVEKQCIAVDINLGCPQHIAKRGRYGAYLMNDWILVSTLVKALKESNLSVPVTCKIRIFDTIEKSVAYAKMIQDAGCSMLTVHGRQLHQKGTVTGLADWEVIKAIKQALHIPVLANGNVLYHEDIERCIKATGVDGVMTAEGNLHNPAIFTNELYASWYLAQEYLEIIAETPSSATAIQAKAHIFKLMHSTLALKPFNDLREGLGIAASIDRIAEIVFQAKERLQRMGHGDIKYTSNNVERDEHGIIKFPFWVAQPRLRKVDEHNIKKIQEEQAGDMNETEAAKDKETDILVETEERARKRPPPLQPRRPEKKAKVGIDPSLKCVVCRKNARAAKCLSEACRTCCSDRKTCVTHASARHRHEALADKGVIKSVVVGLGLDSQRQRNCQIL